MFDLTGRVALITGAASGIGAATARVFAEAGADLALAWYPPDGHDIEPVRHAVEATGRRVVVAAVDVTCDGDVSALVSSAPRRLSIRSIPSVRRVWKPWQRGFRRVGSARRKKSRTFFSSSPAPRPPT